MAISSHTISIAGSGCNNPAVEITWYFWCWHSFQFHRTTNFYIFCFINIQCTWNLRLAIRLLSNIKWDSMKSQATWMVMKLCPKFLKTSINRFQFHSEIWLLKVECISNCSWKSFMALRTLLEIISSVNDHNWFDTNLYHVTLFWADFLLEIEEEFGKETTNGKDRVMEGKKGTDAIVCFKRLWRTHIYPTK